jgi:DNA-binding transcriptional regulator YbjK
MTGNSARSASSRERREVVVVHVPLRLVDAYGVQQLVHPGHAKRADIEHLGVAALEQRRAVRSREKSDLG